MRRARENPDTGAWLVAGGVAVGIVGIVWFLTRSPSTASASTASSQAPGPAPTPQPQSTPGNYNTTYGPPLVTIAPPPVRPDYQITAQNTTVSLKVGQILAIAQPHPAGAGQNWGIVITPAQSTPLFSMPDAAVVDLGWQSDYTDQVKPTQAGTATVTMNLYESATGAIAESYAVAISAS